MKLSSHILQVKIHLWLLHGETFTVYIIDENSPNFIIANFLPCWHWSNPSKWPFHQHTCLLVMCIKEILMKRQKIIAAAQQCKDVRHLATTQKVKSLVHNPSQSTLLAQTEHLWLTTSKRPCQAFWIHLTLSEKSTFRCWIHLRCSE